MKILYLGVCAAALAMSLPAVAAKQDYKCYIQSSKHGYEVAFYRWDSEQLQLRMASLPGKQRKDSKGKKYFIKSVEECVPLGQEFSSSNAKRIDKQTLR